MKIAKAATRATNNVLKVKAAGRVESIYFSLLLGFLFGFRMPKKRPRAWHPLAGDRFRLKALTGTLQMAVDTSPLPRCYNNWYESTFQVVLANALVDVFGKDAVICEAKSGSRRADVVLIHPRSKNIAVIELKHVGLHQRHCHVKHNFTGSWEERDQASRKMSEKEVLQLEIDWQQGDIGRPNESVKDLLTKALDQVKQWDPSRAKDEVLRHAQRVRKFAAILVGSKVIVGEVSKAWAGVAGRSQTTKAGPRIFSAPGTSVKAPWVWNGMEAIIVCE